MTFCRFPLILASASQARLTLLRQAGLKAEQHAVVVDEDAVKESIIASHGTPMEAAVILAEMKACKVSLRYPDHLVIGGDQILDCDQRWYSKPRTAEAAAVQLQQLAGRTHRLTSAVAVAHAGARLWATSDEAHLAMRPLSDTEIASYLTRVWATVLDCVGSYQIEGYGITLFTRIDGDYTTILGMPLLPLLAYLREFDADAWE